MEETRKAGYLFAMAIQAYCSTCQRKVYVTEDETPVCPVCSTPLIDTRQAEDDQQSDDDQTAGAK